MAHKQITIDLDIRHAETDYVNQLLRFFARYGTPISPQVDIDQLTRSLELVSSHGFATCTKTYKFGELYKMRILKLEYKYLIIVLFGTLLFAKGCDDHGPMRPAFSHMTNAQTKK